MQQNLSEQPRLHRLGGDEFAITCPSGDSKKIEHALQATVKELHNEGFESAGASHGTVFVYENPDKNKLMHIADERMYLCKRSHKENPNNMC